MNPAEFAARLIPMKDRIFRFARTILSDPSEAEDAVQDIFEKLWRECDKLDRVSNLEGYVMVSVRNHCYDRLRRRRLRRTTLEKTDNATASCGEDTASDYIDTVETLLKIIASLPDRQREIIHLRDIEGCEIDTISSVLGLGEPTVRVLLSRARKAVRDKLKTIMEYGTK